MHVEAHLYPGFISGLNQCAHVHAFHMWFNQWQSRATGKESCMSRTSSPQSNSIPVFPKLHLFHSYRLLAGHCHAHLPLCPTQDNPTLCHLHTNGVLPQPVHIQDFGQVDHSHRERNICRKGAGCNMVRRDVSSRQSLIVPGIIN